MIYEADAPSSYPQRVPDGWAQGGKGPFPKLPRYPKPATRNPNSNPDHWNNSLMVMVLKGPILRDSYMLFGH